MIGEPVNGASINAGKGAGVEPSVRQPWAVLPAKAKIIFSFLYFPMLSGLVMILFVDTGHPSRSSPRRFRACSSRLVVATKASGCPSLLISLTNRGAAICSCSLKGKRGRDCPFSSQPYSLLPAASRTTFCPLPYQSYTTGAPTG